MLKNHIYFKPNTKNPDSQEFGMMEYWNNGITIFAIAFTSSMFLVQGYE